MIEILEKISLFESLEPKDLEALRKVARIKTFPKRTILFSEGDDSDSFYVVISGQVNVGINDDEGREVILSRLGPGEYFGEMALMDGQPRSAYVITNTSTKLMIIAKNDFDTLLSSNSDVLLNLLKGVQQRLREANKKIESLALMNVYGRVVRILIHLAGSAEPGTTITDKLTHQEIANMVGASREMVSRVLKDLSTDGYIAIEKKHITISKKLPYDW